MADILSWPLVTKELRQALRGPAALVLQNLFLTAAAAIAVAYCISNGGGQRPTWWIGRETFWVLIAVQAVLAVLLGAALASPAVAAEYEQKTVDILRSTPLVSRQIAWSKIASALLTGGAALAVSLPIAGGLFFLGGVSTGAFVCAYALLFAALVLGTTLGLYCSALARHTAAAVPVAIVGALVVAAASAPFAEDSSAIAALTPLGTTLRLIEGSGVSLFGATVPVWAAGLVVWGIASWTLAEAAVQLLMEEHNRRLWGTRWRFGVLFLLIALAAIGSLDLLGRNTDEPYNTLMYGPSPDAEAMRQSGLLVIYAISFGVALAYVLVPLFCSGARAPLDRGGPPKGYSLCERLFGYSTAAGLRYVLLLTVAAWGVAEVGLLLWGHGLADRWFVPVALAFVPVAAAVWGLGMLAGLLGLARWPRSDVGRKLLVFVVMALLLVGWAIPAFMLEWRHAEPPASSEVMLACLMPAGALAAFPQTEMMWASSAMNRLAATLPIPWFNALVHVAGGSLCLALSLLIRFRRARRAAGSPGVA